MTRRSNVRNLTKFKRSIKAISPIVATLLLIAITVVASLVAYAWVTGYIGATTTKVGHSIQIPSYSMDSATQDLVVYVQNVGQGPVQLKPAGSVYVNDVLHTIIQSPKGTPAPDPITIAVGQTAELVIDYPFTPGENVKIKVTTSDGSFIQTSGSLNPGTSQQFTITVTQPTNGAISKGGVPP